MRTFAILQRLLGTAKVVRTTPQCAGAIACVGVSSSIQGGAWAQQFAGKKTAAAQQAPTPASFRPPAHNPASLRPQPPSTIAERTQAMNAARTVKEVGVFLNGLDTFPSLIVAPALTRIAAIRAAPEPAATAEAQAEGPAEGQIKGQPKGNNTTAKNSKTAAREEAILDNLQRDMDILLHTYSPAQLVDCVSAFAALKLPAKHDLINRCLNILVDHDGAALASVGTEAGKQLAQSLTESGLEVAPQHLAALTAAAAGDKKK